MFVVFFFSSRRRHTSSYGDWSSDVCSSDLFRAGTRSRQAQSRVKRLERMERVTRDPTDGRTLRFAFDAADRTGRKRSEERRVGKECRSEGGAGTASKSKVYAVDEEVYVHKR